jgi:hypothetical protein
MYLQIYPYTIDENRIDYYFTSIGPNGSIRKTVRFTHFSNNVYNLGFGDIVFGAEEVDDSAITNNNDTKKVLATIAAIVYDFTLSNKTAIVIAMGNSNSRNRLYRMGINTNWNIISADFEVFGLRNEKWEKFEKQTVYDGFLVCRKNFKFG